MAKTILVESLNNLWSHGRRAFLRLPGHEKLKRLGGRVGGKGTENEGKGKDLDFPDRRVRARDKALDADIQTEMPPIQELPDGSTAGKIVAAHAQIQADQTEAPRLKAATALGDGTVIIRDSQDKLTIMDASET